MKLIGLCRLGRDAELRYTTTGRRVASLSLAYNYGRKDDRQSQWIEASLWGDQAERLAPYLLKGTLIHVILRDVHTLSQSEDSLRGAELMVPLQCSVINLKNKAMEQNFTKMGE